MNRALQLCVMVLMTAPMFAQEPAAPAQQTEPPSAPVPASPQPTREAAVIAHGEGVIHDLVAGNFDKVESQYDSQLAAAIPAGKLAASWKGLITQAGQFQSIGATSFQHIDQEGGMDVATVLCKFEKMELEAHVGFDAAGKIGGLTFSAPPPPPWSAPTYAKADAFTSEPLTVVNGSFELPGTLTMPKGNGPFPAVVLVQGSGPQDEDETIGANKPFKDLAEGLATNGVAVFRYVKRTAKYQGKSSADPSQLTVEDEAMSDARAAVALVAKQTEIAPNRVYLLGHSLGGYLAPRIATGDPAIAGIVLLAANSRPIEQILDAQVRRLVAQSPIPDDQRQKQIVEADDLEKQIESPGLKPTDPPILGAPPSYWLDLRSYSPTETAAKLNIPILILQGSRDFQVDGANYEDWKKALAGRANVTFKLYPDLNHIFVAGTGESTPREYTQPGHVAELVIADVAAWVEKSGKPAAASPAHKKPSLNHSPGD